MGIETILLRSQAARSSRCFLFVETADDRAGDAVVPARTRYNSRQSGSLPRTAGSGIVRAPKSRVRARELLLRETIARRSRALRRCPRAQPALARAALKIPRPIRARVNFCTRPSTRTCRSSSGQWNTNAARGLSSELGRFAAVVVRVEDEAAPAEAAMQHHPHRRPPVARRRRERHRLGKRLAGRLARRETIA